MQLTPHFALAELTHTGTGIPNEAPASVVPKLVQVATLLEAVRAHFGAPVIVHSGYRSPAVNAAIGGASKTSQHMLGEAADFHVEGVDLEAVWRWIGWDSGLAFGQVILEGHRPDRPSWVHLSIPGSRPPERCGEILRFDGTSYHRVAK